MVQPATWQDVKDGPAFIINMSECKDRLKISKKRIHDAGFSFVTRWNAVDARDAAALAAGWARYGSPKFDPTDAEFVEYKGKQGCFLSHMDLWKHIIDNNIDFATVFEDDVSFHYMWEPLAAKYFEATPKDYDLLYMGSQIDVMVKSHILRTPVFCTHAYVITQEGAQACMAALLGAAEGVRTIDCMLIDMMKAAVFKQEPCPFKWYVWNGTLFPDPVAKEDAGWATRNTGMVFQDAQFGSFVRQWP